MIVRAIAAAAVMAVLGTGLLAGCSASEPSLTVFGAASIRDALGAVKSAYAAAVPGAELSISTDSSAALETQIEQGAPADVFLSADTAQPQKLVDAGFASGEAVVFARNGLAVIVPAANPGRIDSPADLARPGLKIVAAGDEVPISRYAAQLVANLAREPRYPVGFAAAYQANVVSKEDNVSAVVAKVALGEGDAGIVYLTDAAASETVRTIDLPADANVPASYAGVVVASSSRTDAAAAFLAWLAGPGGQAILGGFGFLPAGS
ncbi:MAG TPA: molybdate ABC transporter substrate-binding protein [Candidatus Limnocylindria bacterium]|nr:molybdate ABC transporter substrate-binding protein [Candidatus Limnocylindria bacterium]